jgi:HEAT repeat protein
MNLSEIEEKRKTFGEIVELTPVEALSRADEIIEVINKAVVAQVEEGNYKTLEKLYENAAETYLLAAEKVPKESRDSVAFPANYWSMRARQMRLKLKWVLDELLSGDLLRIEPIASAITEMPDLDKQYYLDESISKFKDKETDVSNKAEKALVEIGPEAVESLIDALKDKHPRMRECAARTLGRIGDVRAINELKKVANNDNFAAIRSIAKYALKEIEAKQESN